MSQPLDSKDIRWLVCITTAGLTLGLWRSVAYLKWLTMTQNYVLTLVLQLATWVSWSFYLIEQSGVPRSSFLLANATLLLAFISNASSMELSKSHTTLRKARICDKVSSAMLFCTACLVGIDYCSSTTPSYKAMFFLVTMCAVWLHSVSGRNIFSVFRLLQSLTRRQRIRPHAVKRKTE